MLWTTDDAPAARAAPRLDAMLGRAVRQVQARAGAGQAADLPVVAAPPPGEGRWRGLAGATAAFALARSGVPGAESALGLVRALYDIEDDQARMLNSIQRDVALLRKGPFLAARLLLSEAARMGPADPEYQRMLGGAKDKLYEAAPLAATVQDRAVVELNLGLVWLALGRPNDARHWLQQSYQSARIVIDTLAKQSGDVKVLHSRWSTAALTYLYPVGVFVLPAKLKKIWDAERARDAIQSFLPFLRCVAESLNTVSQADPVPALALTHSASDGFVLGEVPA
ncbi:MAG TPA: hypothetical protein VIZ00_12815 [Streptosporangiaceae bacterium]